MGLPFGGQILVTLLKQVGLEVAVQAFTDFAINSLKSSKTIKEAGRFLIPLRDSLIAKYPLE